jgi:glycosyltransferase involved in cell wall biosynthesis
VRILTVHDDCISPGGSNNYRKQLAAMLRRRGVEIAVFTQAIEEASEEQPYYCYRYREAGRVCSHIERFYVNRSLIEALRQWINFIKPDLIHLHHCYRFPASVLLACKGQAPIVQTVHDFRFFCAIEEVRTAAGRVCPRCLNDFCSPGNRAPWMEPLAYLRREFLPKRFLKRLLRAIVDYFIVPSRALEEALQRFGFRTFFLPHFIDCDRYPVAPPPQDVNSVLFVGYLRDGKGVGILLRAFSHIATAIPSATLEIVGDDPSAQRFKNLCRSLRLDDRVRFYGAIAHDNIHTFYQRASVVAVPSIVVENSPLTVYEAMAAGRPVVASRIGGIPDLVAEGESGLLCTPGDEDELSRKLAELLLDKERAERMGRAGRMVVESRYTPERHLEHYLGLVSQLVSQ